MVKNNFLCLLCLILQNFVSINLSYLPQNDFFLLLSNKEPFVSPIQISNQPSDFYSHLPEALYLENQYEVGLVELRMTKNWINIDKEQIIQIGSTDFIPLSDIAIRYYPRIVLQPKNYENINSLLDEINSLIYSYRLAYNFTRVPTFSIDYFTSKIHIETGEIFTTRLAGNLYDAFPILSYELSELLGFVNENQTKLYERNYKEFLIADTIPYNDNIKKNQKDIIIYIGNKPILLQRDNPYKIFEALYKHKVEKPKYFDICTDIINYNININKTSNVISRVYIPQNKQENEIIIIEQENPTYFRINHNEVKNILVQIKDSNGELVKFPSNTTIWAVFEFRKRKYNSEDSYFDPVQE